MRDTPTYYSVIPATVRYDKNLTYFEIILYSEIVALSNAYGYSFASNNYFAELYKVSTKTITRSILNLSNHGHISVSIDVPSGNKRKIYIIRPPMDKIVHTPIDKKVPTPTDKKVHTQVSKDTNNNTSVNNLPPTPPESSGRPTHKRKSRKRDLPDIEIPWLEEYWKELESRDDSKTS